MVSAKKHAGKKQPAKRPAPGELTAARIAELGKRFAGEPAYERAQNAVTQTSVDDLALRRSVVTSTAHTFSVRLDDWKVTNQKASGRCWLFAGLNLLRVGAMKKMNLKNFEFSQNHAMFWDKLERANFFLENIIKTAGQEIGDREVMFLLSDPLGDGGQWNMFVNVVRKHGVVPKSAMPETQSSSATRAMNRALVAALRKGARRLRELAAEGAGMRDLRAEKKAVHELVHRILSIHLGTPPETFDWQWRDKDKKFHRHRDMTPLTFAEKYVELPLDEYVCLVHDPRPANPTGQTYTVKYLGNVVGGAPVVYLNVDVGVMKKVAMRTLKDGEPVWMGCDVGKFMRGDLGIWDAALYDYGGIYDADLELDKADRLLHGATRMTHAMLFTGVDIVGKKPRRWRVENSWGEDKGRGQKGFYTMNDSWFDEFMFEIAAHKRYLPRKLVEALDAPPTVLPPWDPMGSLARM